MRVGPQRLILNLSGRLRALLFALLWLSSPAVAQSQMEIAEPLLTAPSVSGILDSPASVFFAPESELRLDVACDAGLNAHSSCASLRGLAQASPLNFLKLGGGYVSTLAHEANEERSWRFGSAIAVGGDEWSVAYSRAVHSESVSGVANSIAGSHTLSGLLRQRLVSLSLTTTLRDRRTSMEGGNVQFGLGLGHIRDGLAGEFEYLQPLRSGDSARLGGRLLVSHSHLGALTLGVRVHTDDPSAPEFGVGWRSNIGRLQPVGSYTSAQSCNTTGLCERAGTVRAGVVWSSQTRQPAHRHQDELLRIDLSGTLAEAPSPSLPIPLGGGSSSLFSDLLLRLRHVAESPYLAGVVLRLDGFKASSSQLWEIREALAELRDSGKQVVLYIVSTELRPLQLAASADAVFVAPSVQVLDTGLRQSALYLANFLRGFGIEANFVAIGDFKSAPERYTRSAPSPEHTLQVEAALSEAWQQLLDGLAQGSHWPAERWESVLATGPLSPETLESSNLVDDTIFPDEFPVALRDALGRAYRLTYHLDGVPRPSRDPALRTRIAILHIDGAIKRGASSTSLFGGGRSTGSRDVIRACEELANDTRVAGVILRITSPGGSAVASEEMHRALSRLAQRKPIVVSMGGSAASGGYYAASIDAEVFATPSTLTGSIGIYAGTLGVDALLARAGVERHGVSFGGDAPRFDGSNWSAEAREAMEAYLRGYYDLFLERVSSGRELSIEEVEPLAGGRVWTGRDARSVGLVDQLGGFLAAHDSLLEEAGLSPRARLHYSHHPTPAYSLPTLPWQGLTQSRGDWGEADAMPMGQSPPHGAQVLLNELFTELPFLELFLSGDQNEALFVAPWLIETS